jgi:hypothetical protein
LSNDVFPTPPIPYTPITPTCGVSANKEYSDLSLMEAEVEAWSRDKEFLLVVI